MSELHIKLGALLKLERERQNLDLEDVATNLNMAASTLEAIEAGDPSGSPSELYFELFTKSYAQLLGIDYAATTEAIREEIGPETPPPTATGETETPGAPGVETAGTEAEAGEEDKTKGDDSHLVKKLIYLVGIIIVVFAIFLVLTKWIFGNGDEGASEPPADDQEYAAEFEPATGETTTSAASGYDWNVPEYEPPGELTLDLKPRNESWSTVVADGDTVLYRTLYPGRTYNVTAQYRLNVSIGIPSAVDVFLNDQEVNLRNPETGRIFDIEVDHLNLEEIKSREVPTRRNRPRTPPAPTESVETEPDTTANSSPGASGDE